MILYLKHILILCCTIFLFEPLNSFAGTTNLEEANSLYSAHKYGEAEHIYRIIIEREGPSISLYYNLANSLAQQGQYGQAILYYERALRLGPQNPDIRHNLKIVREEAGIYQEMGMDSLMENLIAGSSMGLWSSLLFFFLIGLSFFLGLWATKGNNLFFKKKFQRNCLLSINILGIFISALLLFLSYKNWPAYIVTTNSPLLISPFNEAKTLFELKEGEKVHGEKIHGNFIFVHTANGQSGWVERKITAAIHSR